MIFKGFSVGEQSPHGPTPPTKKQEDTMENRLGYHIPPYRLAAEVLDKREEEKPCS